MCGPHGHIPLPVVPAKCLLVTNTPVVFPAAAHYSESLFVFLIRTWHLPGSGLMAGWKPEVAWEGKVWGPGGGSLGSVHSPTPSQGWRALWFSSEICTELALHMHTHAHALTHVRLHTWELNSAQAGDVCKARTLRARNLLPGLEASQRSIVRPLLLLLALASPASTDPASDILSSLCHCGSSGCLVHYSLAGICWSVWRQAGSFGSLGSPFPAVEQDQLRGTWGGEPASQHEKAPTQHLAQSMQ